MKNLFLLIGAVVLAIVPITGCAGQTVSDEIAAEQGILSRDDAELMIYNELNDKEKHKYTVDFEKEAGNYYYIRVYENIEGEAKVYKNYRINFLTKKIDQLKKE